MAGTNTQTKKTHSNPDMEGERVIHISSDEPSVNNVSISSDWDEDLHQASGNQAAGGERRADNPRSNLASHPIRNPRRPFPQALSSRVSHQPLTTPSLPWHTSASNTLTSSTGLALLLWPKGC